LHPSQPHNVAASSSQAGKNRPDGSEAEAVLALGSNMVRGS